MAASYTSPSTRVTSAQRAQPVLSCGERDCVRAVVALQVHDVRADSRPVVGTAAGTSDDGSAIGPRTVPPAGPFAQADRLAARGL